MAPPLDPIASLRAALRGHYEIEREIGQGAFATVYLARDLKHERKVALKVLHADPSSETGELRFIREIRLLARLQHPNILPLHDSGHVETLLYYVMPYVSGETLRDRIDHQRQLAPDVACNIARDVADALAYAHAQGVIHRDIKPENILLSAGHPVLADFGIARAIDLAGVRQLTRTGRGSPGTPAYMSPEQLMGDKELDGRSDTYSLGCVLFEMLTGTPPFTGKEGFVKRFTEPPPRASSHRSDLPLWMDDVLARALARSPSDRYQTAGEMVLALGGTRLSGDRVVPDLEHRVTPSQAQESISSPPHDDNLPQNSLAHSVAQDSPAPSALYPGASDLDQQGRWMMRMRGRPILAATLVGALLLAVITAGAKIIPSRWPRAFGGSVELDTSRFVILPFAAGPGSTHLGQRVADGLYDAFSHWDSLPLVPDTRVAQVIADAGTFASTEKEALSLARSLGAGRLIWGQVTGTPGSARVRGHMYDVTSGESTREFVFLDSTTDGRVYPAATLELLKARNRPRAADDGDGLTRSYAAWSSYGNGQLALQSWDLPKAERAFEASITADPGFGVAHLWLAQVREWAHPEVRTGWQDHAVRASMGRVGFSARDRLIVQALIQMGSEDFPAACESYRKLTLADSLDFLGWYGLGECRAFDSLVVHMPSSASGWAFRSSSRAAANAYRQALKIDRGAHAIFRFERLQGLLPTTATKLRFGKGSPPSRPSFAAFPSLMGPGDTLAFVPYPASSIAEIPLGAMATLNQAMSQNSDALLDFASTWTRQSDNDAAAFEALADVLEVRGDIGTGPASRMSALTALRRARALSADPSQQLRTLSKEVWLRFKREEFGEARKLADSALAAHPQPSPEDAQSLISLSALTGRVNRLADLAQLTGAVLPPSNLDLPVPVKVLASELFARAALGACGNEVTVIRKKLNDAIDRYVAPEDAPGISVDLLGRSLSMLAPCTNGQSVLSIKAPRDRTTRMQKAYARGDTVAFRAISDTVAERIRKRRPGDLSPDFTFQQAWLRTAVGDTAAATNQLDRSLGALPGVSGAALQEPGSAAGIVRAMSLRADLAAAAGDRPATDHWANAVATLWANADPPLQPTVSRMKELVVQVKHR
jgi:serine/threonine protein kinase